MIAQQSSHEVDQINSSSSDDELDSPSGSSVTEQKEIDMDEQNMDEEAMAELENNSDYEGEREVTDSEDEEQSLSIDMSVEQFDKQIKYIFQRLQPSKKKNKKYEKRYSHWCLLLGMRTSKIIFIIKEMIKWEPLILKYGLKKSHFNNLFYLLEIRSLGKWIRQTTR